ncbi:hypothetical protein VCHA34P131_30320 [Vibrio chagasii]|nr:hypothetical protein VCHA28FP16_20134 [Vibrio chagasii]CAH6893247.1 hypothetical protein VCHA34P131_30320 [Vibrio chagasii]
MHLSVFELITLNGWSSGDRERREWASMGSCTYGKLKHKKTLHKAAFLRIHLDDRLAVF